MRVKTLETRSGVWNKDEKMGGIFGSFFPRGNSVGAALEFCHGRFEDIRKDAESQDFQLRAR